MVGILQFSFEILGRVWEVARALEPKPSILF